MNFDTQRIIDSNGQKYRVGWDEHGWFTLQMVELLHVDDAINAVGEETVEHDGEAYIVKPVGDYPTHSFSPKKASDLINAIKNKP